MTSKGLSIAVASILSWTMLWQGSAGAQPAGETRRGTIIPAVATRADPKQTYALYLPSSYDARKAWPVLFAFDPGALGQRPVECFKEAAEKLGYIVAGSNVSRNGPMLASMQAGLAMMRDALERFAIDGKRIYVTGFSGGARVAARMAVVQEGRIGAVIGCGGGFPVGDKPTAGMPFAFCGVAGNEDFNWPEMVALDRELASLDTPRRLLRFAGGHMWPPPDVAMVAVEWLELQAMRTGTRPRDAGLVGAWLERDLAAAKNEEDRGALYDAWLRYSDLVSTYGGLADIQKLEAKTASLRADEEVKKEIRRERDIEEREIRESTEIVRYVARLSDTEQRVEATSRLYGLIGALERAAENARTPSERRLARRLLEFTGIRAYYAGEPFFDSGDYQSAVTHFLIQGRVHQGSPNVRYRIAATYGRAGNRSKALDELRSAAEHGFSDAARIEQEPGFDKLRGDPRYQQILEAVRKNKQS